jgi:uridine kinase
MTRAPEPVLRAGRMQPLVIGIAGGTGSGKTTVARTIVASLPGEEVSTLEHDGYYRDRPDLSFEARAALNYDHPDALETSLLVEHLRELRAGRPVETPVYDFAAHRRLPGSRRVLPARVVLVEGILIFADEELRGLLDIKIYVDTDADIRAFRRIRRDIEQRGRTFQSVREQYYRTVRPMHLQFVEPSKRYAHVIIPEGGENEVGVDLIVSKLRHSLSSAD